MNLVVASFAFVKFTRQATSLNAEKFPAKLQYVNCLSADQLPGPGKATSGVAAGLAICIAVDEKGSIYALGDKCPPIGQPLSFGSIQGDTISDPLLGTKFSLKTGEVVGQWCPSGIGLLLGGLFEPAGVPTYAVKKSGNAVQVQVDVNYKASYESNYWKGILDAQGKSDGTYY
jgi:nitrite reductase/ring-hydroxylating ferredoxin subunit